MRRSRSFILILLIYVIAFIAGFITFKMLDIDDFVIKIIISDVIATIVVWLFGWIFQNSSIYDPYWSVAPIVIIPLFVNTIDLKAILMLSVIILWGVRLTYNWAYTFKGLKFQDWRYTYYKNKFPRIWQLVNFFGINLMPTIVVILVMLPSFVYFNSNESVNLYTIIGVIICLSSILLELVADYQMHTFRKNNPGEVNDIGLWKYSRHPNYFGEISMWWGVYIMMVSVTVGNIIYFVGPLANTLMFIFISIPLMEKRQILRKPEYANYKLKTSMLIPMPNKNDDLSDDNEYIYE